MTTKRLILVSVALVAACGGPSNPGVQGADPGQEQLEATETVDGVVQLLDARDDREMVANPDAMALELVDAAPPDAITSDDVPLDALPVDAVSLDLAVPTDTGPDTSVDSGSDADGCAKACGGRTCGDDGCGGSCGTCTDGKTCVAGACQCVANDHKDCCDNAVCWFDSCEAQGEKVTDCPFGCQNAVCEACVPDCLNKGCGDDGCGKDCGTCATANCAGLTWTASATCADGNCTPGQVQNCDDGNPCTNDTCDLLAGCQHQPNAASCPNGFCTNTTCNPYICSPNKAACSGNVAAMCNGLGSGFLPGTDCGNIGRTCLAGQCAGPCSSLYLDGATAYVEGGNASKFVAPALTVEAWILPMAFSSLSYGDNVVATDQWTATPTSNGFVLFVGAGVPGFKIGTSTAWKQVVSSASVPTGTWVHLAGQYDGASLTLYVDGKLAGTVPSTGAIGSPSTKLVVGDCGMYAQGTHRRFHGFVDEVRLSSTIRYSQDFLPPAWFASDAQTMLLYHLDEQSGATTADGSGNGNSGLLVGTVWSKDSPSCSLGPDCPGGLACDNLLPCAHGWCDLVAGCSAFPFDGVSCNDGDVCTTGDHCSGGACIGTTVCECSKNVQCDDSNACTDDSCNLTTNKCVHSANSATCDDGNPCTAGDHCSGGSCVAGTKVCDCTKDADCDDKNPCTDDTCSSGTCLHANDDANSCSDGDPNTTGDKCASGVCKGVNPCDDGNVCTTDVNDPKLGCYYMNNTLPCRPGQCSGLSYIRPGNCSGGTCPPPAWDGSDNQDCAGSTCATGACSPTLGCLSFPANEGGACKGPVCTYPGHCSNGGCIALPVNCGANCHCQANFDGSSSCACN